MRKTKPLYCAYTGREVTIEFDEDTRHPGFFARGAFDPSAPFLEVDDALAAFGVDDVSKLRCRYSGVPLGLDYERGLWYITGEFVNPCARYSEEITLRWDLTQRPDFKPRFSRVPHRPKVKVGDVVEPPDAHPGEDMKASTSVALEAAEKFVNGG